MKRAIGYLRNMLHDPGMILSYANAAGALNFLPDEQWIRLFWRVNVGGRIDLDNPQTYNEKLQWLKLYNRRPEYSAMVDKYEVKALVGNKIGFDHIIPTFGVWDRFEDIDFSALPDKFVLKCTHDSGGVVICRDKSSFDFGEAKHILEKSLSHNYYKITREWPYKNVKPRIIAEQYMDDGSKGALRDYKVLCFDGEPKLIELHKNRFTDHHTQDFYDTGWVRQSITQCGEPLSEELEPKPALLEQMLALSRVLAEGIPHIRVDWYMIENQIYFGELTFFDASGFDPFDDPADDRMLGSWITLPEKTI